jgi:hypothetical protein
MFKNIMLMGKFSPRARAAGRRIRRQDVEELRRRTVNFDYLLEDYYRLRELDSNGVPQPERLRSLGLSEVSEALVSLRGTGIPEGGQAFLPVNIKR